MVEKMRPPVSGDVTRYMRVLLQQTEQDLIREIMRKRDQGYVDYAEVAALERVQKTLQNMVDESWEYVPQMIETVFYHTDKDAAGYRNARTLTAAQTAIIQRLSDNLLGELTEAAAGAKRTMERYFTIARLEADPFREEVLKQVLRQQAAGSAWQKGSVAVARELQNRGISAFVDKAGRTWTLQEYGNMAVRTTARQAEVAAILTADDHDLWQIVKIGSTCPVCAPLEGRIYSKSGTNPEYPALSLAFGKVDPGGPEDLSNTYLNIHPNCLHSLIKYTIIGKSEKQIQKDKDFSNPEKNPITRDPRTKKQIRAYQDKVKARNQLLRDKRQHKEFRNTLGNEVPKDFAKFREMKYNNPEPFSFMELDHRRRSKLLHHPELRLPNAEKATAADRKFTHYLFGGDFPDGLAKGRAFRSRLGYDENNWKELKKEILLRAPLYPVVDKGSAGHGKRYEQEIVLYGKKGRPANVLVAWSDDTVPGEIKMVSVYITEVK